MAKNISLMGADYPDVPAVQLPQTGGGTATYYDINVIDNLNSDSSTDALSAKQGKVLNGNLESKVNASKFDFSTTITKWSIFSDSGRKMFMIRGFYKTNTDNDSYMQVIFNSNDKKLTLVRKEGSGSETTLATWSGT